MPRPSLLPVMFELERLWPLLGLRGAKHGATVVVGADEWFTAFFGEATSP